MRRERGHRADIPGIVLDEGVGGSSANNGVAEIMGMGSVLMLRPRPFGFLGVGGVRIMAASEDGVVVAVVVVTVGRVG